MRAATPSILRRMQTFSHRIVCLVTGLGLFLALAVTWAGCRGEPGRYTQLDGAWRLEMDNGASAVIQFIPGDDRIEIDGRAGQMHLLEETLEMVRLELTGPDGGRGVTLLRFLEDGSITMQREGQEASAPLRLVRLTEGG